mmetsp:Transcript_10622/g.24179  ORF Transcript_10622/g.24179 Transcript_10622/m.24179 type:complete len:133 (-) Transcript_10622:7-405(-)
MGSPGGGDAEFTVLARATTVAGAVTCAIFTPFDVLCHSAQASVVSRKAAPSIAETFRAVVGTSGYRALWRGVPPALVAASATPSTSLLLYELQKGEAIDRAITARMAATFVFQPFEFFRTIRQGQLPLPGGP